MKTKATVDGKTYRTTNRRGAPHKPAELKTALRFTVNLNGIDAKIFLENLAKSGMKRQEYASMALVMYSNNLHQIDG